MEVRNATSSGNKIMQKTGTTLKSQPWRIDYIQRSTNCPEARQANEGNKSYLQPFLLPSCSSNLECCGSCGSVCPTREIHTIMT